MRAENEQENYETWQIYRAEGASEFSIDSFQYQNFGQSSRTDGCESFGSDRAIREGTSGEYSTRASSVAGGTIRQLISRSRDRLAKLNEMRKAEIEEINLLESALKNLEQME